LNGAGGYRVQIAHRGNLDLLYFDELSREAGIRISDTHELIKVRVKRATGTTAGRWWRLSVSDAGPT
jgi:hypothetical protein